MAKAFKDDKDVTPNLPEKVCAQLMKHGLEGTAQGVSLIVHAQNGYFSDSFKQFINRGIWPNDKQYTHCINTDNFSGAVKRLIEIESVYLEDFKRSKARWEREEQERQERRGKR